MRTRISRSLLAFGAVLALLVSSLVNVQSAVAEDGAGFGLNVQVSGTTVTYTVTNDTPTPLSPCDMAVSDDWGYPVWIIGPGPSLVLAPGDSYSETSTHLTRGFYSAYGKCGNLELRVWFTVLTPSFTDVTRDTQFAEDIAWLTAKEITTGWPDGTFRPLQPVRRDAMAAFLYRFAGSPAFVAPAVSPFTDITPNTQFYKEMTWLRSTGISTGWPDGTYRPLEPVNRDAMAAFLYRLSKPTYTAPTTSLFVDVTPSTQFFTEMSWLHTARIATGWPDGTYRPLQPVNRDAMAAFLFRLNELNAMDGRD